MSLSLAWSYHAPASSMQTLAPASVSTWAAIPPPAPEPTTITSYDFGLALTCGIVPILLLARGGRVPGRRPNPLKYERVWVQNKGLRSEKAAQPARVACSGSKTRKKDHGP